MQASGLLPIAPTAAGGGEPARTPFLRALLAPWSAILRPRDAAQLFAHAGWPAVAIAFEAAVAIVAVVGVLLFLWGDAATGGAPRSLSQVWHDWQAGSVPSPSVVVPSTVFGVVHGAALLAAWLFLPDVHRTGRVLPSFGRSLRAVCAGVGFLAALSMVVGACWACAAAATQFRGPSVAIPVLILSTVGSIAMVICWVAAAIRAVREDAPAPAFPPCCDGCGYDLTHRPESGVCPECGLVVDASLGPGARRRPTPWERRRDAGAWVETTKAVLRSPSTFFTSLPMQAPDDRALRFATWHHVLMGLGAAVWIAVMFQFSDAPPRIRMVFPLMFGTLTILVGWTLRRLLGALVASIWVATGLLPDHRRAARIIAYETAYLWAFCLWSGVLITIAVAFPPRSFPNQMVGLGPLRLPLFAALLFSGNLILIGTFLWRLTIAGRAARWANV